MEKGIYRYIIRFSLRDQVFLVLMSAAALPFLYLTLELPKIIINDAIGGTDFPRTILGMDFEQVPFLLLLCGLFLFLVIISGTLKYFTATYRYRVGDRLLRRLRYDLIERVLRFPSSEFRNLSSGQIVSMITAETSTLGFFIAEAFAVPAIALGTLSTIVLFMFMQNWMMGVAAILLYPVQIYLIPKLQQQINALRRGQVQELRGISQRIGDVVAGVNEIHGHDTSQYELADFSERLGAVFNYRRKISSKRYLTNVLNQFFSQLTPFFFLSIGGYLVIKGEITIGALVAVLAAYKDMYAPWKDLIEYYQKSEDARVRYDQLTEVFARNNLLDKNMIEAEPPHADLRDLSLVAENVVLEKDEGVRLVDGATVDIKLPAHAAILGAGASGREEFARLLARQEGAHSGRIILGDKELHSLPDSFTGRRMGYVGSHTYIGSGSLRQVLEYPLKRRPRSASERILTARELKEREEALRAGNSPHDTTADWIDYEAAGCRDAAELEARIIEILHLVNLDQEVYRIGLRQVIAADQKSELANRLIEARHLFLQRLQHGKRDSLIEGFDPALYNSNASVAENLLFGSPVGPVFATENLSANPYIRQVLNEAGLVPVFLEIGHKLAAIMSEIFRDLPPGHEFFDRFSFIGPEDLPVFDRLLRRIDSAGYDSLSEQDRNRLMTLPFDLVEEKHHVDLIDQSVQERLLHARRLFAEGLPASMRDDIQFFDPETYLSGSSVIDNIVFGKPLLSRAGSASEINRIVADIVDELDLRDAIIAAGLQSSVGVGGAHLSAVKRQKVALARCLLKRPDILIMSDALSSLDMREQEEIVAHIRQEMKGRSLLLFESDEAHRRKFEKVLLMDQGRIRPHDEGGDHSGSGVDSGPEAGTGADDGQQSASLNKIVNMLMDIPLFTGIGRSKLKLLAFTAQHTQFEPGEEVFRQGETGNRAYVVIKGEAEVVLELPEGEKTVAVLGRNEIFGELALLSNIPRTTTIRAKTPLVLLSISQDVFLKMIEENSEIATAMMRVLAERLASTLRDYGKVMAAEKRP
jgi:ABC-type multidrug transport system fused ATPase/permease subunit